MHPGGTNIIKSNGGVDCSKSFDLLAHTNNPEVSSLLTKYYIGELTPKPAYHSEDLSMLYDLWKGYLHIATEQIVAAHFEVGMIMESSVVWFQGDLFNMGGVRRFYHYQTRLLQNGFSTLFGSKLQELYLKISFTLASAATSSLPTKLPDVLGVVARAKGSTDAVISSNEISQIGQFTSNSESARLHEKGIIAYAQRSVQYDMEFLEAIREEACAGMDAFSAVMELDTGSDADRVMSLAMFLMQVLERMANKLEAFYAKIARYSVFQPELEANPARTRWNILKRKIWDGSFFILTREKSMKSVDAYQYQHVQQGVDFDHVVSQIEATLNHKPLTSPRTMDLNEQHAARAMTTPTSVPAYEQNTQSNALHAMSSFMNANKKAIRRLSKLPQSTNLEQLMQTYGNGLPTPPSSRSSSRSIILGRQRSNTSTDMRAPTEDTRGRRNTPASSMPNTPIDRSPTATMSALMNKMHTRPKRSPSELSSPAHTAHSRQSSTNSSGERSRSTMATGNLRAFRLQASAMAGGMTRRSAV